MTALQDEFERSDRESQVAFLTLCREELALFIEFVFGWELPAHQRLWVAALQALLVEPSCWGSHGEEGECFLCWVHREGRLLIVAFPGAGKTETLLEFLAWAIGRDPENAAFGIYSVNDNIATERSMQVQEWVWSPEPGEVSERYAQVFPGIRPAGGNRPWSQERWFLRRNVPKTTPTCVAAGITGSVIARRLRGSVMDDPQDLESAASQGRRQALVRGYKRQVKSRLLQGGWSACIMPRWHQDDLAGHIMAEEHWPTLRTPLVDEMGEPTWPQGYDKEWCERIRAEDEVTFQITYQGNIVPEEGAGQLEPPQEQWPSEIPIQFKMIIQSWDTAEKPGRDRSETVCETWGLARNGRCYLLDVYCGQPPLSRLLQVMVDCYWEALRRFGRVDRVLIEEASSGTTMAALLWQNTPLPIKRVNVGGRGHTRDARIEAMAPKLANSVMPANALWKQKVRQQILSWPHGRNDILMAAVQALEYLQPVTAIGSPPKIRVTYTGWQRAYR